MTKKKEEVKEENRIVWSFGVEEFQQLTSGRPVIGTSVIDGKDFVMEISLQDIGWEMMRSAINQNEAQSKYPTLLTVEKGE